MMCCASPSSSLEASPLDLDPPLQPPRPEGRQQSISLLHGDVAAAEFASMELGAILFSLEQKQKDDSFT